MNTFETVKQLIVDGLNCEAADVTMEAVLSKDLGADSLDAVDLIMALEEKFDIRIPEDKAEAIASVGDAVRLIDALKASM